MDCIHHAGLSTVLLAQIAELGPDSSDTHGRSCIVPDILDGANDVFLSDAACTAFSPLLTHTHTTDPLLTGAIKAESMGVKLEYPTYCAWTSPAASANPRARARSTRRASTCTMKLAKKLAAATPVHAANKAKPTRGRGHHKAPSKFTTPVAAGDNIAPFLAPKTVI